MTSFTPNGRFVNLSSRNWNDRAVSAVNRSKFYALIYEADGGNGGRGCLPPARFGGRIPLLGVLSKQASSILLTFNKENLDFGC